MVSVNISIKKEAYNFLKSLKAKDASFSDVILEFKEREIGKKGSKESVMKFFGVLKNKNIDWKAKEKRMGEFREEFEKRLK
ncbi:MAG: antitoxin VapB family protein [Nanoarchaeota archaeon]|nr:antitoxin VapB family protein [Nanoarchaeota archaeon]MBU4116436.1 antitoxin VapB family protein [Nanoarchaeota archaeon]